MTERWCKLLFSLLLWEDFYLCVCLECVICHCSLLFIGFCLQLSSHFFGDLLDSIIVDVASECHRIARLGLDHNLEEEEEELKLSAQARVKVADPSNSSEANSKYVVDIFGQTHPPVANDIFECMNCSRSIMAGRFAPHLEKCMGKVSLCSLHLHYNALKFLCNTSFISSFLNLFTFILWQGRKARLKVTRSTTAAQNRYSRGSPVSTYSPYSNSSSTNRVSNGTSGVASEEYSNGTVPEPWNRWACQANFRIHENALQRICG